MESVFSSKARAVHYGFSLVLKFLAVDMLKSLRKLFVRLVGSVVPVRFVSTFFGIGYLPVWQEHWASLFALFLSHVFCYIFHGGFPLLGDAAFASGLSIAPIFLQLSVGLLVLGMLSIFVFQSGGKNSPPGNYSDVIIVQIAFGQLLTVAMSMPAVAALYGSVGYLYNKLCVGVFVCPLWVNHFMHLTIFFLVPFLFFNIVTIVKPWPVSTLQLRYSNFFSIMLEGLILAIYAAIVMYIVAFICLGLRVSDALEYNSAVFLMAFSGYRGSV